MTFPENLRYTKTHEWLRVEGETGIVGITEYAQGELGDVVFVELPQKGKQLKAGDSFGTVEAVKAVSDLYAPVAGEILASNAELGGASELVNKDPYGGGWMIKIKIKDKQEVSRLLDAKQYRELIGK
jgi:glycine cleavage system H protein